MSYQEWVEKVEKHLAVLENDEREFHVAFRKYLENYFTGFGKYASSEWWKEVVLPTHHLDTEEMVFCFCFHLPCRHPYLGKDQKHHCKNCIKHPYLGKDQKHHCKNCIKRTLEFINEPQWKYNNYVQDLRNKILLYCL